MKKIFVLVFLVSFVAAKGQDFTSDIDTLYGDYSYEYLNGSIPQAEKKAYNLLRVITAQTNMMMAIGTGDVAVAAAALADLNSLLGTAYSLPTFNFDETAQSYLAVDSLNVGGQGYLDSLVTWPGVLSVVSSSGMVAGDSTWVQDQISDSVQAAITLLRSDISDSVAAAISGDSTWVTVTIDSLKLKTAGTAVLFSDVSNRVNIKSNNIAGVQVDGYKMYSMYTSGWYMPYQAENDISFAPNKTDLNTGISWTSADKLELQAGDSAIAWFYEINEQPIAEINDSLVVGGRSNFLDSVYLNYAIDAQGDEQWAVLSATGALFGDSISDAGHGLKDRLPSIFSYLNDTKDGELYFRYYDRSQDKIVSGYGLSNRPTEAVEQLQWGLEHAFRYIYWLWVAVISLLVMVVVMVVMYIFKK